MPVETPLRDVITGSAEVADVLGVEVRTLYKWIRDDRMPAPDDYLSVDHEPSKSAKVVWWRATIETWFDQLAQFDETQPAVSA